MEKAPVATSTQISPPRQAAIPQLSSGTPTSGCLCFTWRAGRGETTHPQGANGGRCGTRNASEISDGLRGPLTDGCFL